MIKGFDASHIDEINWDTLSPDFQFCIIKKSENISFTDPYYEYRKGYLAGKMLHGFYHFMQPGNVQEQLNNYLNGLNLAGLLPPILDAEVDGITPEMVTEFLAGLKEATNRKPMLYCDPGFYKGNLKSTQFDCYMWVAAWQPETPHIPWDIWQNSQYGTQDGELTGGNLDIDMFDGTVEELAAL